MRDREEVRALLDGSWAERNAGFWPADGWLDLIVEIHERLRENPDYRIVQIKEKFGGLRYYATGLNRDEIDWLRVKEDESFTVCQECGSRENVELRDHGWIATLCAECDGDEATRGYHLDN